MLCLAGYVLLIIILLSFRPFVSLSHSPALPSKHHSACLTSALHSLLAAPAFQPFFSLVRQPSAAALISHQQQQHSLYSLNIRPQHLVAFWISALQTHALQLRYCPIGSPSSFVNVLFLSASQTYQPIIIHLAALHVIQDSAFSLYAIIYAPFSAFTARSNLHIHSAPCMHS